MIETKELSIPDGATLLYKFIRGSHAHGTNTPTSDVDTMAIYMNPLDTILGLRKKNDDFSADEKNDNVGYDIEKFMGLLVKSNQTVVESLFVEDDMVEYMHPLFKIIKDNRDKFITKDCLNTFLHCAFSQVSKAKGYNKLCAYPEDMERKQPIDFCYTFNDYQGVEHITQWLENRGLKQIYCGLNHLSNMNLMHGVFYDWGQHLHMEFNGYHEAQQDFNEKETNGHAWFWNTLFDVCDSMFEKNDEWLLSQNKVKTAYELCIPKGYHGIVKEDGSSCDIHLDSIEKGDIPICHLSYNKDGYQSHCNQYKEWLHWKIVRNKERYESNFGTGYDAKNMSECIRLLTMAIEISEGKGFNVNRSKMGDREYLLDIKQHKYTYEELLYKATMMKEQLEQNIKTCDLPEHVDVGFINSLLIQIRKEFYCIK